MTTKRAAVQTAKRLSKIAATHLAGIARGKTKREDQIDGRILGGFKRKHMVRVTKAGKVSITPVGKKVLAEYKALQAGFTKKSKVKGKADALKRRAKKAAA